MSLLPPQLHYTDWSLNSCIYASPETQQSKLEICKGKVKGPGEQLATTGCSSSSFDSQEMPQGCHGLPFPPCAT